MENSVQPAWLDNSFVKTILHSKESSNPSKFEVLQWTCKYAVPLGSNYLSNVYRISVIYQVGQDNNTSSVNIIMKTSLKSGNFKEMVEANKGYEKEVKMYREVLPAMCQLHKCRLTARSFECPLHNSVALEDLSQLGYKMTDRLNQLDPAHCRQALTTLARFHAVSVALRHKFPHLLEFYRKIEHSDEVRIKDHGLVKFGLGAMATTLEGLEGCQMYAEIIKEKIHTYTEAMDKIYQNPYGLEVLCHGDAWSNNILFKYNDCGEVIDCKLVDFQITHTTSFAIDILYFWLTSANLNTRENYKEEMFEVYRETLNQTLEEVGSAERLSKEEFDKVISVYAPYSLEVISGRLPFVMADPENLADFNEFTEDEMKKPLTEDSLITVNYRSKYYKAALPGVIRQADDIGAFC